MKKINLLLCALSLIGTVAATGNESKDFDRIKKNSKVGDTYATCNLSTTATVSNSVTCNGGRDGSVNATPSNGTEPYTYMWGDGNSNSSETGLSAGTYSVTVTDNTGCTATAAATVTQPSILNTSVGVTTNVTCNGGSDGSVSTTPSNGTSPYTYSWAGGGTNSTETGLSAGTYSVTVTDNCGTTATASTTITQPTGLSISATASSSVICFGKYDTLSTTVSGGNVPYTYSWTTGSPTGGLSCSNCQNPVATPACSTTFTITVTDNNGCNGTSSVTITVDNPNVSASSTENLICRGASSTLNISIQGGASPFTYAWTPSQWLTCSNCSSPTANPPQTIGYNILTTDTNGCSSSASVTVNVDNINVSANINPNTPCSGLNVVLSAIVQGGVSPFTYNWSPGSGSNITDSIPAPPAPITYSLSVSDSKGCSASASSLVTPDNFSVYLQPRTTICANEGGGPAGGTSGLYAQPLGGVPPYTYAWSTGNQNPLLPYVGLSSGIYSVTVTDGHSCTATAIDTLTVNPASTITITSSKNPIQIGWVDTLTANGGTSYLWNNGTTENQIIVKPKISNDYNVIGWNMYGCSSSVGTTVVVTRDYFLPSPDTLIPHLTGFPPIYYDGNVSIGGDSVYSPRHSLEVHGNTVIDSTLKVGNTNSGININGQTSTITSPTHTVSFGNDTIATTATVKAGTLQATYFKTDSIVSKDSNIFFGDWQFAVTIRSAPPMSLPGPTPWSYPYGIAIVNNVATSNSTCPTFLEIGAEGLPDAALNVNGPCYGTYLFSATNNYTDVFTIDPYGNTNVSGKVVIGNGLNSNTTHNYGLYVGNGILASLVKIALPTDAINWSDYVFANNYKLKSLTEVSQYINKNKHLPEVPSAEDIQKDGIDVAKMDATLLKKIEELTLYLIQDQKQAQEQQKEIEELKAQLENIKKTQN